MLSRCLIFSLLVCSTLSAFTAMTSSWTNQRKTNICNDFCASKTQSNAGNFNMQTNGWVLCFCQAGTTSGEWTYGGCFAQCVSRCLSSDGKCANLADKNDFQGACCTTAEKNATVNRQCFIGTKAGGVNNGDCYQQV